MRKFLALTSISLLLLCFSAYADQSEKGVVSIAEEDGSPETYPWQVKVTNGSLTDNGDGTASLAIGAGGSGDSVTVNSTAIDTTGNLKDSTDITWAITDGGVGGPDDIAGTVANDSHNHTSTTISGLDVSADINLTAGDALTLTDDDIDFDGGASPGGELGGTWASPTVDATHSGSAHSSYLPLTGGTLSGALTINDNNAAGSTLLTIGDATDADSIQVYGDITISGGDLLTGNIPFTIGDATTDSITFTTDGTGNAEFTFPNDVIGDADIDWGSGAGQVGYADIGSIVVSDTSITAGRSLTWSTNDMVADAELYTDYKSITIETPTDADNFFMFEAPFALTITRVHGIVESATSAVITFQECDSAGNNPVTIESITADVDGTIVLSGDIDNAGIDAGDIIRIDVGTVTGTVGQVSGTVTFTKND